MSQNNTNTGTIVIANRGSGNISILNEETGELIRTVDLPSGEGELTPEPMYVYNLISTDEIIVDDRANNRVVFFDSETFEVTGTVETGAGNFHMWASPQEDQIWVVNDLDNTLTVIDPQTRSEITRVALPEEVIGADARPHDVIIDPSGDYAYVTVIQDNNPDSDLLVKVDARDFTILDTAEVGKDPHVSLSPESNLLYVPAAESDRIEVFDRRGTELVQVGTIEQPGAHGIEISANGEYIYTTNLPGGGDNGLFTISSVTNEIIGDTDGVDTPFPIPHNVWLTGDGERLFLTHSGGESSQVSFYSLEDPTQPVLEGSTDVEGLNPFGLAYAAPDVNDLVIGTEDRNVFRGGIGNDFLYGGAGNDVLRGNQGDDKLFGEAGKDRLAGNQGDDVLIGGEDSDRLFGGGGNDLLIGVSVESFTPGANEIDTLTGNNGADTFVLGDALEVYYDDGQANTLGLEDYAVIQDFDLQELDVIRLHGSADNYSLINFEQNTLIFNNAAGQTSELIGVVAGVQNLQLDSDAFEFASV